MNLAGTVQINNRVLLSLVVFMTIVFVIYSWNRDNQETGVTDNISLAKKINVGELLCAAIAAAEAGGREVRDTRMKSDSQLNEKVKGKTKEGVQDVLTDGDLRSHRVMYSTLTENFPDIKVISEEHDDSTPAERLTFNRQCSALDLTSKVVSIPSDEVTVWIDPLDATREYTQNLLQYVTTMVCVAHKGEPIIGVIHNPFDKKTYWAWVNNGLSKEISSFHKMGNADKESFIISLSHAGEAETYIRSSFPKAKIQKAGGAGYKVLQIARHQVGAYVHLTNIKKWDVCAGNAILNALGGRIRSLSDTSIRYDSADPALIEGGLIASFDVGYYSQLMSKENV